MWKKKNLGAAEEEGLAAPRVHRRGINLWGVWIGMLRSFRHLIARVGAQV